MNMRFLRSFFGVSFIIGVLSCKPQTEISVADAGKVSYIDIMQKSVEAYTDSALVEIGRAHV